MSKENSSISKDVAFGFLPASKNDRVFGMWDLILIQVGIGISCICILTGAYTGLMVNARDGLGAILFGESFPILLIVPITIYFARYGIDTFIGFRSSLGYLGAKIFYFIFAILTLGYTAVALYMAGQAIVKILSFAELPNFFTSNTTGVPLFAILLFIIAFVVTFKGPLAIKKFNWIGVPAIGILLVGLLILIIAGQGFDKITALRPAEPYEDFSRSFMTAMELNVGLGFSWLPYFGQYARLVKSEKAAYKATFFSYGILVNIAVVLGALTTLIVGTQNPTEWMLAIAGTWVGLLGLVLLTLGNLTAAIFLMYSQVISLKTIFPKSSWLFAMSTTIPAIFLLLSPTFYNAFNSFMTVIAYIMSIAGGIVIADFFFVKKQKISLYDLYNTKGRYKYWHGINPSAITSFIIGTTVYWGLYNPLLDQASGLFQYISAGIPAYFASLISYYISAKYIFAYSVDKEASKTIVKPVKQVDTV
jgi:nucleobase:cation symporter-1, NCS1 family